MLPADVAATVLTNPLRAAGAAGRRGFRELLVAFLVFPLVGVACVVTAFRLLEAVGFSPTEASAGSLGLLFCTSFLHYTQYHQENTLQLLLTLGAYLSLCRWATSDSRRDLLVSALLAGAGLLVRLTMALDALGLAVLAAGLAFRKSGGDRRLLWGHLCRLLLVFVPVLSAAVLLDRAVHFARFGSFTGTYIQLWAEKQRDLGLALPEGYPFSTPFRTGFLGFLFSAKKSIFLFDPLLVVTPACWFLARRRVGAMTGWVLGSSGVMLVAYLLFYSRFTGWTGDWAWGSRYLTTPVWMLCLPALPLLLRCRPAIGRWAYGAGVVVVGLSLAVQAASVVLPYELEYYQYELEARRGPHFVIGWRFQNIGELVTGGFDKQGLVEHKAELGSIGACTVGLLASPLGPGPLLAASQLTPGRGRQDPDAYTTLNMYPFRFARFPGRLARLSMATWLLFLVLDGAVTACLVARLLRVSGHPLPTPVAPGRLRESTAVPPELHTRR
jgi:hypothetical protein